MTERRANMAETRFEKLDHMRQDIKKDKDKVARLLEQIKRKEMKLKETEADTIVAQVLSYDMRPEQLDEFLKVMHSGKLNSLLKSESINAKAYKAYESKTDETEETNDEE